MLKSMNFEKMKTNTSLCVGCNKCIFKCPTQANNAQLENGENKIRINNDLCIYCGECINICDHKARIINDDCKVFFDDLANGKEISIIAAPSMKHNIPDYLHLFGYLKTLGVKVFYDVSFGADIMSWGYMKAIKERNITTMIAQPCSAIVSYVEKFKPKLIPTLAPIQSPSICVGIYLKKYLGITGDIGFISPCISKAVEFEDENTKAVIKYNVTYKKLLAHLQRNNINILDYEPVDFDHMEGSIGTTVSRPGGLKENVHFYMGEDIWIKQIEGIQNVKYYLNQYEKRIEDNKPVPLILDLLNCKSGCNMGTATRKNLSIDDIDYKTNQLRKKVDREKGLALIKHFDNILDINDFIREYTNKSFKVPVADTKEIEEVLIMLGKNSLQERNSNCFACGFGNCYDFANAVVLGQNHLENCFQYTKKLLAKQRNELKHKNDTIMSSLNYARKIQKNLLPNEDAFKSVFLDHKIFWKPKDIVGGDIYWFKQFNDGVLLSICDCTGHGIPGALLTMLVISSLDTVVTKNNYKNTAEIMAKLDYKVAKILNVMEHKHKQDGKWHNITNINDGADLALLFISNTGEVTISAGNIHVFVCDGECITDFKGQKVRIGEGNLKTCHDVKTITVPASPSNKYYIASDGLFDQIGDTIRRPFGYKTFKQILLKHHSQPISHVFDEIWQAFEQHRGKEFRRDDVAFVGFKP